MLANISRSSILSVGTRSLFASVILSTFLIISVLFTSQTLLRFAFSLPFLFFLPGFNFLEIFYQRTKFLTNLQRFVISIGLSIGFVIITNYVMTYLRFPIDLHGLVISLVAEVISMSVVAFLISSSPKRHAETSMALR